MKEGKLQRPSQNKSLTVERLRQFKGLANLSDEEAKQVIESLEKLSLILFPTCRNSDLHRHESISRTYLFSPSQIVPNSYKQIFSLIFLFPSSFFQG